MAPRPHPPGAAAHSISGCGEGVVCADGVGKRGVQERGRSSWDRIRRGCADDALYFPPGHKHRGPGPSPGSAGHSKAITVDHTRIHTQTHRHTQEHTNTHKTHKTHTTHTHTHTQHTHTHTHTTHTQETAPAGGGGPLASSGIGRGRAGPAGRPGRVGSGCSEPRLGRAARGPLEPPLTEV